MVYTVSYSLGRRRKGTYTTTRHLGLEHELDHHHTGAVDGVLLASGSGSAGFIEELTEISFAGLIHFKKYVAYLGGFGHGHSDDLSVSVGARVEEGEEIKFGIKTYTTLHVSACLLGWLV